MTSIWEHLTSGEFMPHGHCYLWLPEILWTHVISDAIVALAYYSIPISIIAFVRNRPDVDFKMVPMLFSAFIFLCGTTHVVSIFTVWNGYYGFQGMIKAATAIVSIFTAIWVWRLLPAALSIPSNRQLRELVTDATSELVDKNRRLGRANSDIENFVSAASHDLKEPLRTLVAYSQLLTKDAGDDLSDDAKQDLKHIIDGARRMQALVNDILDLSRTGGDEMNIDVVSLPRCVDEVTATLEAHIEASNARIIQDDLPDVIGDKVLIRQVYSNLIGNALKFARPDVPPVIKLTAAPTESGGWILSVEDNGIGIDPAYAESIFEPFKRLQGRDHSEGTGIGLAICKRASDHHNGRIWVEPAKGGGSVFRFSLELHATDNNTE